MRQLVKVITQKILKLDLLFLYNIQRLNRFLDHSDHIQNSNPIDVEEALKLTVPVGCSKTLIRVGGNSDGAYLLPNDLAGIEACFSPGTSNIKAFEDELAESYQIRSFMTDGSVKSESLNLVKGYQYFQEKWINGFNDKNSMTLSSWIYNAKLVNSNNLLLQMDIEGAEYESIITTSESTLKQFRIIVIEFHNLDYLRNERFLNQRFVPVMRRILQNFDCVHAHPNNSSPLYNICGFEVPKTLELTFYRKDCNEGTKRKFIPHEKDIKNDPMQEQIHLGIPWI